MIFFVVYTAAIWFLVFSLRRRVSAFVVLLVGCIPLFLLTASASIQVSGTAFNVTGWMKSLGMFGGILHFVSGTFMFVIFTGGLVLAVQRRAGPYECASCRYDLMGVVGEVCPECGSVIAVRPAKSMSSFSKR